MTNNKKSCLNVLFLFDYFTFKAPCKSNFNGVIEIKFTHSHPFNSLNSVDNDAYI